MSFDRPGLPHPGERANEAEIDETLTEEGVELTDGELDGLDHPGSPSRGPVPNEPRHRAHPAAEGEHADGIPAYGQVDDEPVDDPAHDDPAHDHTD